MQNWKEKDLFEWLSENYYKSLVNSKNPISRWDCYDKGKYQALIKESAKNLDIPIYINSTPEGIYLFNLNKIDIKWFTKSLPATTEFKKRIWVKKEITELEITKGIKLK